MTRDALQGASGPEPRHPIVEAVLAEVRQDLLGGRTRVHVCIRLVLELSGEEPAVRFGQFPRLGEHPAALLRRRGEHDPGPEKPHELAPLDAEVLGHCDDEGVALPRADHGEADAGIAARRLDDRLPGLQRPVPLRRLDDPERKPVLDRTRGVEGLDLDEKLDTLQREPPDPHDRCVADGFEDGRPDPCHRPDPRKKEPNRLTKIAAATLVAWVAVVRPRSGFHGPSTPGPPLGPGGREWVLSVMGAVPSLE
jgi:hypothetical protein